MSVKPVSHFIFLLAASLLFVSFLLLWNPAPVSAQCGTGGQVSTCLNCHQIQTPAFSQSEWHKIHAGKNTCIDCHAGNATAPEKSLSHLGMYANPLSDVYTNCHSCHPADYQQRAGSFAKITHFIPAGLALPEKNLAISNHANKYEILLQTTDTSTPSRAIDLPSMLILSGGIATAFILFFLAFVNFWHIK